LTSETQALGAVSGLRNLQKGMGKMINPRFGFIIFVLIASLITSSPAMFAQIGNTGVVLGTVTDPSGGAIVAATITLTDNSTHTVRTAATNEVGRYIFSNVPPGTYSIAIVATGFRQEKFNDQKVSVGESRTLDAKMEIGSTTETIEVSGTSNTELQTLNATIGNTVTAVGLDALPSLNRDISTFVELQPGVSPDGSVGGAVVDQSTFMLDGGNNTNDMDGSMSIYTASFAGDPTGGVSNQSFAVAAGPTGVLPTPADSVEEFKVNSFGQTADFNSSAGAQIQVVTRRGTDALHGSAYWYYLDNNFSANAWDNNATGTPVPSWHRNRFGARAGGPILPKFWGGKTYLFGNYEGYRWPNSETIERTVPSEAMRLGLLTFGGTTYNLNPYAVTYNGTTYGPSAGGVVDPRGIGINQLVQQVWNKYMPLSNESSCGRLRCDGVNVLGYKSNVGIPQTSDFGVVRIDHDFGDKWHFTGSYRYFKLTAATIDQVDIGGFFGGTLGVPTSRSNAPQLPWYFVAGLTTQITSHTTNDFHYSFLRNYWAWDRTGDTPQLSGLGGALEPFGEDRYQALIPYNVNTQQTRTRFWDGHDQMIRDDVTMLKGNHMFQFGGTYQHNWNYHQRTDNGGGINYQPVYQLGTTAGAGISMTGFIPAGLTSSQIKNWGRDYAAVMGIVSISQQAYTRAGKDLKLNPPLTPAYDQSTIPYYNLYFGDSWRIKPTLTLNYGLGWTLEMPPVEKNGKQIVLVDSSNKLIDLQPYLNSREQAALQGQPYNPQVGFTLVGNAGRKYPYDPYYGSFSPRISLAWNPQFSEGLLGDVFGKSQTVVRGGYGRIYGRLNGVDLVLVPLLGTGLIQPVQCFGPLTTGTCASASGANPTNAFRIGTDGLTAPLPAAAQNLPQPLYPGINGVAAAAGETLDPHFRPNVIDSYNVTVQRQFSKSFLLEVGYIGRRITHEYQPINLNTVPYMMTQCCPN
jgi:Carboxypeptidase regulatory-like domain